MEFQRSTTTQIALKWGFIGAIISIAIALILYFLKVKENNGNVEENSIFVFHLVWLVYIIINALLNFRRNNTNALGISQAMACGVSTSAIWGLFLGIYNYFFLKYLDNSLIQNKLFQLKNQLILQGKSATVIETELQRISFYYQPSFMILIYLGFGIVFGFIITFVLSIFLRRSNS